MGVGAQLDSEAPARHAQTLDFHFDCRGQLRRCMSTQAGQLARFFLVVTGIGRQFLTQLLDRFIAGVQAFQLFEQAVLQRHHFGRVYAVFARQGIDSVEAFLDVLQTRRVCLEVVEKTIEFADRFFHLDLRRGQHRGGFAQRVRCIADAAQAIQAGGQRAEHVARIVFAAVVDDLAADAEQRFGVGQVLVFLFQLLQLVFTQAEILQLFQLIAEQLVACALLVAGIRQAFEFLASLPPFLRGQLHLASQVAGTGIFVEQAAMGVGLEQRLVLVLAVDVDQQLTQRLEVAQRAGGAVDVAARTALGGDHPAQNAGAVGFQVALGQPGTGLGDIDQVERGQDVGLVGAGANHAAVGTVAQGQAQRIEHDRFAGAGLARDHAHPALEFEVEMFDDGIVVYGQVHQHKTAPRHECLVIYTVFHAGLTIFVLSSFSPDPGIFYC